MAKTATLFLSHSSASFWSIICSQKKYRLPLFLAVNYCRDDDQQREVLSYYVAQDTASIRESGTYLESMLRLESIPNDPTLIASHVRLAFYVMQVLSKHEYFREHLRHLVGEAFTTTIQPSLKAR